MRHRRLGFEVEVTDVKDGGKKIRYREKSGFKQSFTDAQSFELVRKCPVAPAAAAPMDDPSIPLDPAKLFPDSAALDRYHCPIDNLKYGENPSENFLCDCARCCCFKDALLSALADRQLTLPKEAVRSDRSVVVRNFHLVCLLVRFDQSADFFLSDGRLARDLMTDGMYRNGMYKANTQALFLECGTRSISLSGLDAGPLEMFDKLVSDHVKKNSQEWKDEQAEAAAEKDRVETIRKEERLNEARSKVVVKQVAKTFNEYIPDDPPVKLDARVHNSWQSAWAAQYFMHAQPDFVLCQHVLTSLMAENYHGLFSQVTPKLQQIIVRHVTSKEHQMRLLFPSESNGLQQKRVTSEDLSIAAELCVASFSRHVDLLEPFIERNVVTAMRSMAQQEQANAPDCDVPQPPNICGTMRPYQIQGLNWLLQQVGSWGLGIWCLWFGICCNLPTCSIASRLAASWLMKWASARPCKPSLSLRTCSALKSGPPHTSSSSRFQYYPTGATSSRSSAPACASSASTSTVATKLSIFSGRLPARAAPTMLS